MCARRAPARYTSPIAVNHDDVAARLAVDFETVATKNRDELTTCELTEPVRQTETLILSSRLPPESVRRARGDSRCVVGSHL